MDNNISKHFEKLEDDRYILGKIQLQGTLYYISEDQKIYSKDDDKYTLVEDENTIEIIKKVVFPTSKDVVR
jgi:hypothetical protein